MKTKISLLTIALFCLFTVNAQLNKPHFISLNVGTSIPLSDYKEVKDQVISGGAKNGFSYSIEGAAYLNKFLGIGANIGLFNNGVDNDALLSELEAIDNTINKNNSSINTDDWINGYAMVGPYLSFGSEKFVMDLKFLAGLMSTKKPVVNINTSSSSATFPTSAEEVVASNIGFNYGLHFRIKIVSKLGLRINAEQFSSQQEFKGKIETKDSIGNIVTTEPIIKQQISTFNLGAGLVLTF
ncbi:MAG: hypothetical protein CMO34_00145 [Verrucomicrobia bacterium]|nr:hypothetical protein [Verrucomicrobiota bacterium]